MNRIRELRIAAGYTQSELGEAVGVTQGAVNQWETGVAGISFSRLRAVADALGCEVDDLVERGEESDPGGP